MKHILMVDDVTTNLKCAAEVLNNYYKVSMVKSGKQALDFLSKIEPDLILLDISMPDMDGYETMEKIMDNPSWRTIPVIFLTADTDGASEIRGFQMGAMDYIRKPFEPDVMLSRINKILNWEAAKKNLEITARKDSLTNLWNRRYMEEKIDAYAGNPNHYGTFMIIDVDHFKDVNDHFGHLMGDAVLVQLSKCLQEYVSENDILCRIGGDEFILFFSGVTDHSKIKDIAHDLNGSVMERVNFEKGPGHDISLSIGIAVMPDDGIDFQTLYNKSDKALYFVKENGRRDFHFYQEKDADFLKISENESIIFDLEQLKDAICEKNQLSGAYEVGYDGFRKIYQFISRTLSRSKRNVQVVLFSLIENDNKKREIGALERAMSDLEEAIVTSLRRGDVTTAYSGTQYVVILMDTSIENGEMVADRIIEAWTKMSQVGVENYSVTFDIGKIETGEKCE